MERRDAIAALMLLPTIRLAAAKLDPTDVIVVESDSRLSYEQIDTIQKTLGKIWPNRKILVFDAGLRMKLVQG